MMLRGMAERDAKELLAIQKNRDTANKNKSEASQALLAQMQEKKQKKELVRETDAIYASQVAQNVQSSEDKER
jgi:hypothetical protein